MSATLGDVTAIAASLEEHTGATCDLVVDAPRPVPLSYDYVTTSPRGHRRARDAPRRGPTLYRALLAGMPHLRRHNRSPILASPARSSAKPSKTRQRDELLDGLWQDSQTSARMRRRRAPCRHVAALSSAGRALGAAGPVARHLRHRHARRRHQRAHPHRGAHRAHQSSMATRCVVCAPASSIRLPVAPAVRASTPRGMVIAEAPEHEIENAKLMAKAGDDPKNSVRLKGKKAPEGFVTWNKQTFERLIETQPETLKPRLRITHSMVISVVEQGGDARTRVTTSSRRACKLPRKRLSSRFAPTKSSPRSSIPASSFAPRCRPRPTPRLTPRRTSTMR